MAAEPGAGGGRGGDRLDGRAAALGLDPRRSTRVIELTLTGSPIGKHNALDDASQDLALFVQDEDACLDTLLARHNAHYASPAACDTPGFEPPRPERKQLERRLRQLGPKKAARLKRRLPTA